MTEPVLSDRSTLADRLTPRAIYWAILTFVVLIFALTSADTMQGGDTAEFARVGAQGGVAHPPGYPLTTLLAMLFAKIPLHTVFFRVSMMSAVAAAIASAALFRLVFHFTQDRVASVAAALAFALSPLAWKLAGVPEVFTINACLAVLLITSAVRVAESDESNRPLRALVFGLVGGLGVSNHHTIILLIPIALWAVIAGGRNGWKAAITIVGLALLGFAIGLLPYLSLPLQHSAGSENSWIWGRTNTWKGFWRHFFRGEYGTFSLGVISGKRAPWEHVLDFWRTVPTELFFVYAFIAPLGVYALFRKRIGFAIAWFFALLFTGVLFLARFNLPESAIADAISERFYLLPLLLLSIAVGFGAAFIRQHIKSRVVPLILLAPLPFGALIAYPQVDWRHDHTAYRYVVTTLSGAAPNAVIVGEGDLEGFCFPYARAVLGIRPDVRYLDANMIRLGWYHERIRKQIPELTTPFYGNNSRISEVVAAIAERAPTYVTTQIAPAIKGARLVPEGLLVRVLPKSAAAPPPEALEPSLAVAFSAMFPQTKTLSADPRVHNLDVASPQAFDAWGRYLLGGTARVWRILADAYDKKGQPADALRCRQRAGWILGVPAERLKGTIL